MPSTVNLCVVDVAVYSTHPRSYSFEAAQKADVAYVAGMPYFVALLEVKCIAVVPAGVRV